MGKQIVLTRKAAMTMGALHGFLKPRLAADAKLNLIPILSKVTTNNFAQMKPKIAADIKAVTKGKLAKDASVEGLAQLLDALGEEKGMDDPLPLETEGNAAPPPMDKSMDADGPDRAIHDQIRAFLKDKLSPEDMAAVEKLIASEAADEELGRASEEGEDEDLEDEEKAEDEPPPFKGRPEVGGGGMTKDSMNKAIKAAQIATDAKIKAAVEAERQEARAVREAERFVRPWVGDLQVACDSAHEVYGMALKALNVDTTGVPKEGFKAILEHMPKPSDKHVEAADPYAMDSAASNDFFARYPDAKRIGIA